MINLLLSALMLFCGSILCVHLTIMYASYSSWHPDCYFL
jgi:nitrogen fixation protein FixH